MQVRKMQPSDFEEVAALSEHLGYPIDVKCLERRFGVVGNDPTHGVFVAQAPDSEVIGWVHVYGVHLLESNGYAEKGGNPVHFFGANDARFSIQTTYARGL
jgi:hypothetical protein